MLRRQLAREGIPPASPALVSVDRLEQITEQMNRSLTEMSDLAYLRSGLTPHLALERVDLIALVQRLVQQQHNVTPSPVIEVRSEVVELVGPWDVARLERAVTNLLANAIKYSPTGGIITVEVRRDTTDAGAVATLVVSDQGIGIPPRDLATIFDLGRRGSNVPSSIPGNGIGLASVRQSVELHGGSIVVESQEGRGSTFTVRLPLDTIWDNAT